MRSETRTHGTVSAYTSGCRCTACREAQRVYRRAYRDRARAVNSAAYQRDLAASRAFKQRQRGVCERCGGETRYNGTKGHAVSRFCATCNVARIGGLGRARRGSGPVQKRLLELLDGRELRYSEIRDTLDIPSAQAANLLHRALRYGLVERVAYGVYRKATT